METERKPDQPTPTAARVRGRRIAIAVYYAVVGCIVVAATGQVMSQVFVTGPPSPYSSCRDGLFALASAVDRARRAAAEHDEPGMSGITGDEDAALERFRAALDPEWRHRDGVAATCRGSERDERTLDAIERLRYAEEHAVRREAGDLAPLRRRVQTLVNTDLAPAATKRGAASAAAGPPDGPLPGPGPSAAPAVPSP